MPPTTRHEYRVLPACLMFQLAYAQALQSVRDGYIAENLDDDSLALRKVLGDGFRRIRTDGEWAVFERPVVEPVREHKMPIRYRGKLLES